MSKENMLYLLNVPWNWIKQRPQYLAEELGRYYTVDCVEKYPFKKSKLSQNSIDNIHRLKTLFRLPFEQKSTVIKKINNYLYKYQLKKIVDNYKFIWICSPEDFSVIKPLLNDEQILIYDCMDDVVEFTDVKANSKRVAAYIELERELVGRAAVVYTSAVHLKNVLVQRSGVNRKLIKVVNNAISDALLTNIDLNERNQYVKKAKSENYIISYIGTISDWMDWPLLEESVKRFANIEYHFYGPIECSYDFKDRIKYKGIIPQNEIYKVMEESDALVMPFKITPLVKSVNPVKMYEYIYSGKPVLAVDYSEMEKFRRYAYLYADNKFYFKVIERLVEGTLSPIDESYINFVHQNTWRCRGENIHTDLLRLECKNK